MNKIINLLSGTKVLAESESKYNGHMRVVKDYAWGTYIQADGLTQSGGVVETIWKSTLKSLPKKDYENVLILGLGGGTVAKLIRQKYPNSKITGIEIDPIFIDYGEKYLGLKDLKVKTILGDAIKLISHKPLAIAHYDLIIIDVYQGRNVPDDFATGEFAAKVASLLDKQSLPLRVKSGVAIFNRLYYGDKRPIAMRFLKVLEKEFANVDPIYPQANVMFVCT